MHKLNKVRNTYHLKPQTSGRLWKHLLTISFCSVLSLCSFAQKNEGGIIIGGSYYIGELNPYKHFHDFKPGVGIIIRQNINSRISFRSTFTYMQITGNDASSNSATQQNRNLQFKNNLFEFSAGIDINFFNYIMGDMEQYPATPYLFVEVALVHMNPKAEINGNWYELQPLGTEGQGTSASTQKKYNLTQLVIPFGVGLRMNVSKRMALSFEYGVRKMFTDYLDDVSTQYADKTILANENGALSAILSDRSLTGVGIDGNNAGARRGTPQNKDWYFFSGATASFILKKDNPCYIFK